VASKGEGGLEWIQGWCNVITYLGQDEVESGDVVREERCSKVPMNDPRRFARELQMPVDACCNCVDVPVCRSE
jgi:hypothetical protein